MSWMFANMQRWVILLKHFCFCPNFVSDPGFPVHKKLYLEVKTWVKEVVLKPGAGYFQWGVLSPGIW